MGKLRSSRRFICLGCGLALLVFNQSTTVTCSEPSTPIAWKEVTHEIPTNLSLLWQKQFLGKQYTRTVGLVEVQESGIWVADALVPRLAEFFPATIPQGSFPLTVHLDPYQQGYDIEGASIKFSENPVSRWERAQSRQGRNGVLSDTGLLTFLSTAGLVSWKEELPNQVPTHYGGSPLAKALSDSSYSDTPTDWCNLKSAIQKDRTFPITGTGVGDGYFAAYWGWTGDEVVAFTLQFAPSQQPEKIVLANKHAKK